MRCLILVWVKFWPTCGGPQTLPGSVFRAARGKWCQKVNQIQHAQGKHLFPILSFWPSVVATRYLPSTEIIQIVKEAFHDVNLHFNFICWNVSLSFHKASILFLLSCGLMSDQKREFLIASLNKTFHLVGMILSICVLIQTRKQISLV